MREHKIVPVEATDIQWQAAFDLYGTQCHEDQMQSQIICIKEMYKAMIAAAPHCDQSENTTLRSQVESLLAVVAAKDEAFRHAYDILRNEDNSMMTLRVIREARALKPSDVELVEVAAVDAMETGVEWNPIALGDVKSGGKLYVLKKKEGK
jgi:hypothetical protein